jgi:hypothetical protein
MIHFWLRDQDPAVFPERPVSWGPWRAFTEEKFRGAVGRPRGHPLPTRISLPGLNAVINQDGPPPDDLVLD